MVDILVSTHIIVDSFGALGCVDEGFVVGVGKVFGLIQDSVPFFTQVCTLLPWIE